MPCVPHAHAVVEVARLEAVEVEHRPTLQGHPDVSAARLDARDVTETRHEKPDEIDLALPGQQSTPE